MISDLVSVSSYLPLPFLFVLLLLNQKGQEAVFLCPFLVSICFGVAVVMWAAVAMVYLVCPWGRAAYYTDEVLQAFNNLGLDAWTGIEMDVAWGRTPSLYHWAHLYL